MCHGEFSDGEFLETEAIRLSEGDQSEPKASIIV
jgi:hypothetical protein